MNGSAKSAIQLLILVVIGMFVSFFLLYVAIDAVGTGPMFQLAYQHPAAMIGLPLCALGSLSLVVLLRTTSGPIEFEAVGIKFKGAAGPIIMWTITFLAMAVALKLLWDLR